MAVTESLGKGGLEPFDIESSGYPIPFEGFSDVPTCRFADLDMTEAHPVMFHFPLSFEDGYLSPGDSEENDRRNGVKMEALAWATFA
jgi:hypothetical protein